MTDYPCGRCGSPQTKKGTRRSCGYCVTCEALYHQEATQWQERDYLWRWLHTRADVAPEEREYRTVLRLRVAARSMGIDWRAQPPEPMTYDDRLAALTGKVRKGRAPKAA